jgi:hypothetical protein
VAASGGTPEGFRQADRHRALEIGLRLRDLGSGWAEGTSRRSPYAIDAGAVVSSSLTAECGGPDPTVKTETDLEVTGAAISTFARLDGTLVSVAMLFKTSVLARKQMSLGATKAVKSCLESELKKGLGSAGTLKVQSFTKRRFTSPAPLNTAYRIVARAHAGIASVRVYFDLLLQADGRGVVETLLLGVAVPPSQATETRVSRISARRLARHA